MQNTRTQTAINACPWWLTATVESFWNWEYRMRNIAIVVLLGLLLPATANALGGNKYLGEMMLPVVVSSGTYQSEIYVHAVNSGSVGTVFRATYYGGDGTGAPGPLDCGQHVVLDGLTMKYSLLGLCAALAPEQSHFGTLMLSTVGIAQGTNFIPRIRAHVRVQNYQGIGFSLEGVPPTYTEYESSVIGVKSGVDANGIRYQTNCFIGQHSENYVNDPVRNVPGTVTAILERSNGVLLGSVTVPITHGRLHRVLDVFAASGLSDVFRDGVRIRFRPDGNGQIMPFYAFCTVQDNRNFSADVRYPDSNYPEGGQASEVIQPDGSYSAFFELVGSEVAKFRPSGLSPDSINCFVDNDKMWIRVTGYYDPFAPVIPQVSETGRIRLKYGLFSGSGDIEVGLKDGETSASGYVMCLSGNGLSSLVRVR